MPGKWSQVVNEDSDALGLEEGVFKKKGPAEIARSLMRSAKQSSRRKATPLHRDEHAHLLHKLRP